MTFSDDNTGIKFAAWGLRGPGIWRQSRANATELPIALPCDPPNPEGAWVKGDEFPWMWPAGKHLKLWQSRRSRLAVTFGS